MEGMDFEAAQATSRHMAARAEVLERLCATAVAALEQAHWIGADRDTFVAQFSTEVAGLARSATDEIGRIVDELNDRIRKQQVVSNG